MGCLCLTDHLITSYPLSLSLPRKSGLVKPSIHINLGGYIYEAHFENLMLGKSAIK